MVEVCTEKSGEPVSSPKDKLGFVGGGRSLIFREVPLVLVQASKDQPRKVFDPKGIEELAKSLKKEGFLQPLVVSPLSREGFYPLIAGERRLRAARSLGLHSVPVVIKNCDKAASKRIALVENIQRRNLNIVEEASAYRELLEEHGYTHEECAKELGVDRTKVTNFLRLLSLPETIQGGLARGEVSMGHARALLALKALPGLMEEAYKMIKERGLSVRQLEALCRKFQREGSGEPKGEGLPNPNMEYLADSLRQKLKTKVRLVGSGGRGKIEISYFSPAEFERILGLFEQ